MMMNERVEIGGDDGGRTVSGVDEKLVRLHQTLKRIARARAHLDLREAAALREAQQLGLWRQFGHASLADYMVQELGYASHRVAEERLRVANALPALPAITAALHNGDLNFSQAKELVRVATPETEKVWIEKAQDMNVREVEQAVSGHCKGDLPDDPIDPRLARKSMWLSVRPETEVLFREARKALDRERGERLDDDAALEALCRSFLGGASARAGSSSKNGDSAVPRGSEDSSAPRGSEDSSAPRGSEDSSARDVSEGSTARRGSEDSSVAAAAGAAPYRIAVTVCTECKRGWQHGAGAVEEMSPAAIERATCDAQWIGDLTSPDVERARQEIPPATRRKVLHRDQQRCQVPGCQAHRNLDIHHIVHRERGGTNDLTNLITLCEAHHTAHHDGTLRVDRVEGEVRFRREGRNSFTRATREVATREALRKHGFDRDAIKQIMTRTVAHVGPNQLTDEQWLAIALRYAERTSS